jgi:hypothetical protein
MIIGARIANRRDGASSARGFNVELGVPLTSKKPESLLSLLLCHPKA